MLVINTTIPNKTYFYAGIKINTPGYQFNGTTTATGSGGFPTPLKHNTNSSRFYYINTFVVTAGSDYTTISVLVLDYACLYHRGYIFLINDSTPTTSSIGGKGVSVIDQSSTTIAWGLFGSSVWGIDNTSTPTSPSPNSNSSSPATLLLGQLNCDAINDGACATNNMLLSDTTIGNAASFCNVSIDEAGNSHCSGGSPCFTDWYLPAMCDMGPYGITGLDNGRYPYNGIQRFCITSNETIQQKLTEVNKVTNFDVSSPYWDPLSFTQRQQ